MVISETEILLMQQQQELIPTNRQRTTAPGEEEDPHHHYHQHPSTGHFTPPSSESLPPTQLSSSRHPSSHDLCGVSKRRPRVGKTAVEKRSSPSAWKEDVRNRTHHHSSPPYSPFYSHFKASLTLLPSSVMVVVVMVAIASLQVFDKIPVASAEAPTAVTPYGTTELNMQNLDMVLKSAQVVFVAFCADWCPFSRKLRPVFEEAAKRWHSENPASSVVWALVDSVAQADVADKYFVNKYPTMKVFINGELITKEYRSTRSVDALMDFVKKQLEVSIMEFPTLDYLNTNMSPEKRNVIAYFHCRDCVEYQNFQKVAALLREDCAFWVGNNEALNAMQGDMMSYRDPVTKDEQKFNGNFQDYDFVKQWLTDKCIPLVREVTFENVEELTEEGLPFLLFFRDPNDKESERLFVETVARELHDQKGSVNALLADGQKFAHPLRHLGKTTSDLPVLAIDSFQHIPDYALKNGQKGLRFLFDKMEELPQPGRLRQFILDLHSGKLHKEFHETLDQRIADLQRAAIEQMEQQRKAMDSGEPQPPGRLPPAPRADTTPVPSVFKDLKPSDKRYSLLDKTEL